jgi:outer membrane protein assembly factor BamB
VTISSPTIAADGTAVLSTDDSHLVAVNPNGSIRWTVSLPAAATAPPSHGVGDLLYVGTVAGDILALKLADGSTAWTYSAGSAIRGPLAIGCDAILYAASDGAVLALALDAAGLADSPWPKAAHDVRGTGDARRTLRSAIGVCLE